MKLSCLTDQFLLHTLTVEKGLHKFNNNRQTSSWTESERFFQRWTYPVAYSLSAISAKKIITNMSENTLNTLWVVSVLVWKLRSTMVRVQSVIISSKVINRNTIWLTNRYRKLYRNELSWSLWAFVDESCSYLVGEEASSVTRDSSRSVLAIKIDWFTCGNDDECRVDDCPVVLSLVLVFSSKEDGYFAHYHVKRIFFIKKQR